MSQTSSTDTTVTGGATTTKTTSLTASPATMLRELLHDMVDFTHTRSLQLETSIRGKIDTVVSMMEAGAANVKDDATLKTSSTTSAAPVSHTTSAGPGAFSVNNGGTVLSSGTTASGAGGDVEHVSSGGSSSATVETGSGTSEVKETTSSGSTTS